MPRRGAEGFDNKNLVWVGYPANIASRLTDVANKSIDNSKVNVKYYPYNFFGYIPLLSPFGQTPRSTGKIYQDIPREDLLTNEEFAQKISFNDTLGVTYSGGQLIRFDKIESKIEFPPILMTSRVFSGFKTANPTRTCIVENYWKKINNHNIKNVDVDVYGGTVKWVI